MLEALYEIGKIIPEDDNFLNDFIEDIGTNYKHVFKIIFDIDEFKYLNIDYEEFDSDKKLKYFYKKGFSNGPDKTPTSKITTFEKVFSNKISQIFKNIIKNNEKNFSSDELLFFQNLEMSFNKSEEKIKEEFFDYLKNNNFLNNNGNIEGGGIVTFVFKKDNKFYYVGELDEFKNLFLKSKEDAYKNFYIKGGKVSKSKDKYCYICKKEKDEVYGFVSTFQFYTVDKRGMVTGGFKKENAWKNYPVCLDCAVTLERGKKFLMNNLKYKFCGFNYLLIPQLIVENDVLLKNLINRIKSRYSEFSSKKISGRKITQTEEKILEILSKENNSILFNFIFFEKTNNAFNILLELSEIPPSRLNKLVTAQKTVDLIGKESFFKPIILKKGDEVNFNFSFYFIREFFLNNKIDGKFNKYFLDILNNIFIDKNISYNFLLNNFMKKIRSEFLNNGFYDLNVLKAFKIVLYLNELNLLDKKFNFVKGVETVYEEFFEQAKILDTETKKALFLEGVLTEFLLNIQYKNRKSKPFMARLNGLKINEKIAKRLLPEIINKLEEYDENYYRSLETEISKYMLNSNFSKYTVDEMSFYFVLGMTLAKNFKNEGD
ncbi:type I-B CRISPR-associated protein Cas8b/Csh1 [Tepiditoga spiralis]|uniref:Type I-B CRISPR-associated protein Cas8b/Csh1 n=1 Tax=Tepiditoga spiralis TaxID=2108365 RepID=A0A7G1G351_9BACT|nr:TIGR02556 family CRISPR-associated protein [Tepiditoga spiralis]BBE30405.1 type I-B CRISPR-associated protein Cas8b/Csh1 [Tepiditoga spiralis]